MDYNRLSDIAAPLASLRDLCSHPFNNLYFYKIDSMKASVADVKQADVVVHELNAYPVLIKG